MTFALGLLVGDALAFYIAWALARMSDVGDDDEEPHKRRYGTSIFTLNRRGAVHAHA